MSCSWLHVLMSSLSAPQLTPLQSLSSPPQLDQCGVRRPGVGRWVEREHRERVLPFPYRLGQPPD
eukprot:COSAG03_NODE_21724_length_300_cov_0.890547_1_plen_64_part_10